MPDSGAHRDSTRHSRDFEAQMLVDLLSLSRLTVLYGAEGAGKTTFLKTDVLPLLRASTADGGAVRGEKSRVVVPFTDRHAGDGTAERGAAVAIIFDRWDGEPLPTLLARILDTLRSERARMAAPLPSLADSLAAWNAQLGARFFIIFDCFEEYLRAPLDRAGILDFEEEFVRAVNTPDLDAHFLISVREDAEPLLNRFRGRINGFGDAFLRLPHFRRALAPAIALSPHSDEPLPAAAPLEPVAGYDQPLELTIPTAETGIAVPPVADAHAEEKPTLQARLYDASHAPARQAGADATVVTLPPHAAQGARRAKSNVCVLPAAGVKRAKVERIPEVRPPRDAIAPPPEPAPSQRAAPSPVRLSLAAIAAGFAVGLGAGFVATYGFHGMSIAPIAASEKTVVPMAQPIAEEPAAVVPPQPAEDEPVAVVPPEPDEDALPAPRHSEPAVTVSQPKPQPRLAGRQKKAGGPALPKATASAAALQAPVVAGTQQEAASPPRPKATASVAALQAPVVARSWQAQMRRELEVCAGADFLSRMLCTEVARWKHCAPDRWNTIPECTTGTTHVTRSD